MSGFRKNITIKRTAIKVNETFVLGSDLPGKYFPLFMPENHSDDMCKKLDSLAGLSYNNYQLYNNSRVITLG